MPTEEELAEARQLQNQINSTISYINSLIAENEQLSRELDTALHNVTVLADMCVKLDRAATAEMTDLADYVGETEVSTTDVLKALNELSTQYFTFKSISSASRNLTQFNDEYSKKYRFYNQLRRISLGYVIGLDSNIISSETARKAVEKEYLQNSEYWLAYSIAAVMLWASDEKDACERAVSKSLTLNPFNACLFYLLINLRFGRIEAAKRWYINYLDRVDTTNLGDEWQYLLQAFLLGAFGSNEKFNEMVVRSFHDMMKQVELTYANYPKKVSDRAKEFAELFVHNTKKEYTLLWRNCAEYEELKALLTDAEKTTEITKFYEDLLEEQSEAKETLPQRIENVLYSLVNDYDDEEQKLVEKIKYNEAIVSARGDVSKAQAKFDDMYANQKKKKNIGDLLMQWAFADSSSQTDITVKRFAVDFLKSDIISGMHQYVDEYRSREKMQFNITIDECHITCGENGYEQGEKELEAFYNKRKGKMYFADKQFKTLLTSCIIALLLAVCFFFPPMMVIGLVGLPVGIVLLVKRIKDLTRMLEEKKRKSKSVFRQTLEELAEWRADYKSADALSSELFKTLEKF